MTRERGADDRDFDQTYLSGKSHGAWLHRDYTAHFFRWAFVERFTRMFNQGGGKARLLEIGCGPERPLPKILHKTKASRTGFYLGLDLNKTRRPGGPAWDNYIEEFNFVDRWPEIVEDHEAFDLAVHLEVFEHMQPVHGREMLKGVMACLRAGGYMIMSTPCYNGKWQAKNHIHEYEIDELRDTIEAAGFVIEGRFGTFANVNDLKRKCAEKPETKYVWEELSKYYSHDSLSCIFAPLFPDDARNNLWVCKKPEASDE